MVVKIMVKLVVRMGCLVERDEEEGYGDSVVVVGMVEEMEEKKVEELVVEKGGDGGWKGWECGRPKEGTMAAIASVACWKRRKGKSERERRRKGGVVI